MCALLVIIAGMLSHSVIMSGLKDTSSVVDVDFIRTIAADLTSRPLGRLSGEHSAQKRVDFSQNNVLKRKSGEKGGNDKRKRPPLALPQWTASLALPFP